MEKQNLSLSWTQASTDIEPILLGVLSCRKSGHYAYAVCVKNETHPYPVQIKNPALDDVNNWTMSFGIPTPPDFSYKDDSVFVKKDTKRFFNATEKELYYDYEYFFGVYDCSCGHTVYKKNCFQDVTCPKCGKDVNRTCRPVKIKDAKNRTWVTEWTPVKGVSCWIPDPDVDMVFAVAFTEDKPAQTKRQALLEIADFIKDNLS